MTELIDKRDALAQIKSIPCSTIEEFACKELAMNRIKLIPTTTEADIRAKTLKRVQTAFRNHYETMRANGIEDCVNWADWLDSMIAEQLKGESTDGKNNGC